MFKSSENLRLAAEMRALERVARPWRAARRTWFDGTPESIEGRLASTERVLTFARAGTTTAHMALEREAARARAELREAGHRLMVDFLDDGARAFKGSKRVSGEGMSYEDTIAHIDQTLAEGEVVGDLEHNHFQGNDGFTKYYGNGDKIQTNRMPGGWNYEIYSQDPEGAVRLGLDDGGWAYDEHGELHDGNDVHRGGSGDILHPSHAAAWAAAEEHRRSLGPVGQRALGEGYIDGDVLPDHRELPRGRESRRRVAMDTDELDVECPDCGADQGEPCLVAADQADGGPHHGQGFHENRSDPEWHQEYFSRFRQNRNDGNRQYTSRRRVAGDAECGVSGCYEPATEGGLCEECHDDLVCPSCGERNDNGEGFDGYCGNCADRLENEGHWGHHDAGRHTAERGKLPDGRDLPDEADAARRVLEFMHAKGIDTLNIDDENPTPSYQRDFDDEDDLDDAVAWVPQELIHNPDGNHPRAPWNPVLRRQDIEDWFARKSGPEPHREGRRRTASGDWGAHGRPQTADECENCGSPAIEGGVCQFCGEGGPRVSDPKKWPANVVERERKHRDREGRRRTAGGQITDHEFRPYSDGPEYCVAELPSSGDTCNEHFTEHARVDPEDRRFLDGGNHL
jgi:hypothetical protein